MKISLYPLYDLNSELKTPFEIENGVSIIKNTIDINKIDKTNVSEEDSHNIKYPLFCLSIEEDIIPPEKASIAFIVSCRLLKRTKVYILYRIDFSNRLIKVSDDYPFVTSADVTNIIDQDEFKVISHLFSGLNKFKTLNTRTGNAVYFLGMAYRSKGWLESLIFHVCALETLISASNIENKITEKFKRRIYKFVGYDKNQLNEIYNIRSELVHGRYDFKSEEENLRLNRIVEEACRKVFSKIFLNDDNIDSFENDEDRLKLFKSE